MTVDLPTWVTRENLMLAFLAICVFAHAGYLTWSARSNPLIRCTDIMTGDNGRLASNKTFQAWAFGLSAWAMVYLTVTANMDAIGWGAWVAIWSGAALANKAVNNSATAKSQEIAAATGNPPPIPAAKSE